MLTQQIFNGLVVGSVYALFSLGFTLVFGVQRILNLAHGALLMAGAFAAYYLVMRAGIPIVPAFVLAIAVGALLGAVLEYTTFRPLRRRGGGEAAAMISSIGANMVLISIAQQLSNAQVYGFPFGTFPHHVFLVMGLRISLLQIFILVSVTALTALLVYGIFGSSFGRQVRAVAINERTASLLGIDVDRIYTLTFVIAGTLAAAAGLIIAVAFNSIHFLMGENLLLRAFVVVVLGGMGSIAGSLAAGLVLGLVQTLTTTYISSQLSDAIIFGLLFVVLLIKPNGLFPGLHREARVGRQ
jgi:branched-chain amino acid transport system permease protein